MGERSAIEWCDATVNFWTGCTKVSPACDHCYAETLMDTRYKRVVWGPHGERVRIKAGVKLAHKLQRGAAAFLAEHGRRMRVFSLSLGDWLDNQVPIELLVEMLDTIRQCPDLDWLLLTKRPQNWRKRLKAAAIHAFTLYEDDRTRPLASGIGCWLDDDPPRNVWIGVSTDNREEYDRRVPVLRDIPARVRFISAEPLLESPAGVDLTGVDWVIAGGESGPNARPSHPDWFRDLRDQCAAAGVPFLFKQWGEWAPIDKWSGHQGGWRFLRENAVARQGGWLPHDLVPQDHGAQRVRFVGKKAAGRLLDGVEHNGFPEAGA